MSPSRRRRPAVAPALLGAVILLTFLPVAAPGQEPIPAVATAERLASEGRPSEAADTLLAYLRTSPEDGGVRWRAAQLLRDAGRTAEAADQYERAMALLPADPWLRLEGAAVLLSLGRLDRADEVVGPILSTPGVPSAARAEALATLGTVAYWRGDLPEAIRLFEAALAEHPDQESARRQLQEIRSATRNWARLAVAGFDDSQPYRRGRAELETGFFLTPLWTVALVVAPYALEASDTRRGAEVGLGVGGFLPDARMELRGGLGGTFQGDGGNPQGGGSTSAWTGHLEMALRLPREVRLRGRAVRERYPWTLAGADSVIPLARTEVVLDRAAHPGWAGEAALRRETFPDGNAVTTAYGWVLAPLLPWLRAGWAASIQDAAETRWSPVTERYEPYFTPEEQRVQSALAELLLPLGNGSFRLNGSYAVHATELAPGAPLLPGVPAAPLPGLPGPSRPATAAVEFTEREYTPWSAVARIDVPAGDRFRLHLEAERRETAFYTLDRASLAVVLQLGGP